MNTDSKGYDPIRSAFIRVHPRLFFSALLTAILLFTPCKAAAQARELDPAALIDALAKEDMGELLQHLMRTQPPDDKVLARQVQVARLRIEYRRLAEQARRAAAGDPDAAEALRAQSLDAFDRMLDAQRDLIADFYDHEQRPIWQTDLAQTLLLDYLQDIHRSAPLFAEFGVTTAKQRDALAQAGPEALALLTDAKLRFFNLRGELGRDPKRSEQLQSSGLYFRLFDEYARRRTPYFLSRAAYAVALLPDDSPYFAGLGTAPDRRIPHQKDTPDKERARLLELAGKELEGFTGDMGDLSGVYAASVSLAGRVLLARGRAQQAIGVLDELISTGEGGVAGLTARLARVAALQRMGKPGPALDELARLRRDPMVTGDLRFGLLVTDMTHRVMLAQARQLSPNRRDAAVAASYQPYLQFLAGPIPGDKVQGLRDFIYRRWESSFQDRADAGTLPPDMPPVVRMAVCQVLRQQGQQLAEQVARARQEGADPAVDIQALRQQADGKLDTAIKLAGTLTAPTVDPAIRSEAMFNLAMAMYWTAPKDPENRLELTGILTDLAEQMPAQPVAEDAITASVALLREMHRVLPTPVEVQQAYERATGVLFKQFPVSAAADGERLYYGYAVLQQAGRYREAMQMYQSVPFDHDDYFPAQRQALICLGERYKLADPTAKPRIRRELDSVSKRIALEAGEVQHSLVNPERAKAARRAAATARLIDAELAMGERDFDAVLKALDGFEQDYPDESDLIGEALRYRIVALGDAGRPEELAQAAQRMIRDFPDEAASVIDGVLQQADRRIDRLQVKAATAGPTARKALLDEAKVQATTAAMLSGLLLEWAKTQGLNADQMMPFELIRAKTLRLSGRTEPAAQILGRLVVDFPNDAQVMLEYAQVLYDRGDEDSLVEAVRYYDRLITGLGQPFPREWWVAWMRRLQINDRLNEGTEEIPLRVRQLRMTDPSLGGPLTKLELERLEHKHSR
jgi:hypothetical protein